MPHFAWEDQRKTCAVIVMHHSYNFPGHATTSHRNAFNRATTSIIMFFIMLTTFNGMC